MEFATATPTPSIIQPDSITWRISPSAPYIIGTITVVAHVTMRAMPCTEIINEAKLYAYSETLGKILLATATAHSGTPAPDKLRIHSGNRQRGIVTTTLAPFVVQLIYPGTVAVSGHKIVWEVVQPKNGYKLSTYTTWTNEDGYASSILTLGENIGTYTIIAYASGTSYKLSATFTAYAEEKAGAAARLGKVIVWPNPCYYKVKPPSGREGYSATKLTFGGHVRDASRNLTKKCRIRIYNITGELVIDTGDLSTPDGKWEWNMLNDDNEPVAAGVYIYLVTNPEDKEQKYIGKFILIK